MKASFAGWFLLVACALPAVRAADPLTIAAAANLLHAVEALNAAFRRAEPDVRLTTSTGASGSLFAQIRNGAPFDVFLSADTDYPRQLVTAGLADRVTLTTFATGRLVVWTTRSDLDLDDLRGTVRRPDVKRIALAQPKAAPYGRAAQAALRSLGVTEETQPKLVTGESIAQTAQFVETGNADVGFVALSLVIAPTVAAKGRWKEVAPELYRDVSLDHAAVLTSRGAASTAARRYLAFLASDAAKSILREFGYRVPENGDPRVAQPASPAAK